MTVDRNSTEYRMHVFCSQTETFLLPMPTKRSDG